MSKKPFVILDGAHNPEAMEKLCKSLLKLPNVLKIHAILACFKDKNLNSILSSLGAVADTITLTTFDHPRAREESDYFLFAEDYEFIASPIEAYRKIVSAYPEDLIIFTGSLAFCGYIKELIENKELVFDVTNPEIQ